MGLREVKAARTREHIVDVAIELFIAQGYDQTTMEQIAEKAEVAPSTLYRYFTSKDLLVAHRVTLWVAKVGAERAEHAAVDANVRRVEMRVDIVVREVAVLSLSDKIGEFAHLRQRHIGSLEHEAVFKRQPFAGFDLVADGFQNG